MLLVCVLNVMAELMYQYQRKNLLYANNSDEHAARAPFFRRRSMSPPGDLFALSSGNARNSRFSPKLLWINKKSTGAFLLVWTRVSE